MYTSSKWDSLFEGSSVQVQPLANGTDAEYVDSKGRETDSYGDYIEGDTEIWVIFKVGERYFKKFGYQSSYGGREWDGGCVEVFPETKTITVFK